MSFNYPSAGPSYLPSWNTTRQAVSTPTYTAPAPYSMGGMSYNADFGSSPLSINPQYLTTTNGNLPSNTLSGGQVLGTTTTNTSTTPKTTTSSPSGQTGAGWTTPWTGANPGPQNGYQINEFGYWTPINSGPDYGQINSVFDEVNNILNQQESSANAGKQSFLDQYTGPFDAMNPDLESARTTGLQRNQLQRDQVSSQEANAINNARNMYNEMNTGFRQRFGGSSSTGQFAGDLANREFLRNYGNITNQAGGNMQSLMQNANEIETNYQAGKKQLDTQRAGALAQAQQLFQQKLDAINNARVGTAQAKANAQLQVLQELRNQAQQINSQFQTAALNLDTMARQQAAGVAANVANYRAYAGKDVNVPEIQKSIYSAYSAPSPMNYGYTPMGSYRKPYQY